MGAHIHPIFLSDSQVVALGLVLNPYMRTQAHNPTPENIALLAVLQQLGDVLRDMCDERDLTDLPCPAKDCTYIGLDKADLVEHYQDNHGTGETFDVPSSSDPERCEGHPCVIHNPSDHPMREWPLHWRGDRGIMERMCEHGIGHPDPDDTAYRRSAGLDAGTHGCDGCCFYQPVD